MGLDFDVLEFCKKLRNSKQPPYHCPVVECGKSYKSMCGLQYHLVNFDHTAPQPLTPHPTPGRKKGRGSHGNRQPSKTSDLLNSPTREALTYAEAQKMVEFEFNGRATRVSISEPLPILSVEEFQAKYKNCVTLVAGQGGVDGRPAVTEEKIRLPEPVFTVIDSYNIPDAPPRPNAYIRFIERSAEELDVEVEYDMDEEDAAWLSLVNGRRATCGVAQVAVEVFELLMDRLEKESYFQAQTRAGEAPAVIDDDAVCCICMDGECQNSNVILFCDMCNLAVHQDCYGVPYIPEGQWLCRRCLQSPSRAVDCVLCPNNGGAFKQTDRGHWAHVVCALWIPEVRFANTVFLEPIDSIETIPPARWKLTCYICKQRGVGACIQCHKTNCYSAFHVTCAQHAGLFMKMDTVRDANSGAVESGPVLVQKTAFCDNHTPPDASPRPLHASKKDKALAAASAAAPDSEDSRQKLKKARRILAKKRSSVPVISIPTIPPDRIQEIASLVTVPKKNQLIQRLIAYWTLKRQYRNGVPLLRRLQSSHLSRREEGRSGSEVGPSIDELYRQLKYWQQLRQDLEKARLLCELVRKRERNKNELTKVYELELMGRLQPLACSLRRLLELIRLRDTGEIFLEPVDPTEVLDYSAVVKEPMDLSTMRLKIDNCQYSSLDAFEADFNLMIKNCMAYNSKDTIFYRAAIRMRDQGGALIRQARRDLDSSIDPDTGMLCADRAATPAAAAAAEKATPVAADRAAHSDDKLAADIDKELAAVVGGKEGGVASSDRLSQLLDLLDRSQDLKPGYSRVKRIRLVKTEISKLRRKMSKAAASASSDSEREESSEEERGGRPTRQARQADTPAAEGKRPRKKKSLEVPSSPPGVPVTEAPPPAAVETEPSPAAPTTPVKPVPGGGEALTPHTVSPSGVNRRTAVLFTRKAQAAFRKSDPPPSPTPPTESPASAGSSRRRVGRPRKNLDSSLAAGPDTIAPPTNQASAEPPGESESSLMPAPPLPCSESFRVYRSGGEIPAETDEETQSDSSCSSCSSTDASSTDASGASSSLDLAHRRPASTTHDSSTEEDVGPTDASQQTLEPLDLVWAKCRGYPWYPALIIDPKMPHGFLHNGVPIPSPPIDVLALAANYTEPVYLVLFFDTKRTWQWLPRTKLEPLGHSSDVDQSKLTESRKPTDRKAVRKAFQEAQQHQVQVAVGNKKGRTTSIAAAEAPPLVEN